MLQLAAEIVEKIPVPARKPVPCGFICAGWTEIMHPVCERITNADLPFIVLVCNSNFYN